MKKSRNISQVEQTPGVIAPELPATPEPLVRPEPDRSRTPRPVKRYRYRFSPVIFGALLLGLALCLGGFGLTTWFFADFLSGGNLSNVFEWLQYGLLYLASVGIGLFIVAVLLRSEYVLTDRTLIVRLGFLRSRTPLENIVSVHLFRGANKLVVYFDSIRTNYLVIVIKESLYNDFIHELTARNEKIGFSFSTPEEEEEITKKK